MEKNIESYFSKPKKWQKEIQEMRAIALDCNLTETFKWGHPCYTLNNDNIVLIHEFKSYCAYLFFKGALIQDEKGLLIQQSENVQAARQIRFTHVDEIIKLKKVLKAYIFEAIAIEKAGLKVALKETAAYTIPEEFQQVLDKQKKVHKAFYTLTPGRQRAYLLHFAAPKQSKTRVARIEKCLPLILSGLGLND
ncbi:MAG: YdeI/OmpD-associated family protein [Bacteroidetes bacterium]|nr:YdeI/OmpD-associated family protein [Bacteroidota bacterium]MBL0279040.1 YdeI/OmpD-associated family protein [Bacteroidota bacterium]